MGFVEKAAEEEVGEEGLCGVCGVEAELWGGKEKATGGRRADGGW